MTPEQIQIIREIIREELASLLRSDRYLFEKKIQISDGRNVQLGVGTGTKIGTATGQKLSFWNSTPVIQQARPTDAASIITTGTTIGIWA